MWTYNREIDPPAPFLDIIVRHPRDTTRFAHISAKIDTAADISALPVILVDQLDLPIARKLIVEGYDNVPISVYTYGVVIEVAQARFKSVRVITFPESYVLLGRDVLNHFYLYLNGPELTFTLSLTPT